MSTRDKRMKASEIFSKTQYLFSKKASFEKAFPQIETVEVEVSESGQGVRPIHAGRSMRKQIYTQTSLSEFIDCSNPLCYNGGFSIGRVIRKMVSKGMTEYEDSEVCKGYEGSPKGRRKYDDCMNYFEFKVKIKYKDRT